LKILRDKINYNKLKENTMKHSILMSFVIGATLIFFGCSENNSTAPELSQIDQVTNSLSKKPAPNLIGEMELDFTFGEWPEEPVWVGTVKFEGSEDVYDIRFFHLSEFRDYSQVSPFEEYFEIYLEGGDPDDYDDDDIYLAGPDEGTTILANKPPDDVKYRMNGEIDVANEPFENWIGRKVHMSGVITWQILETPDGPVLAPDTAPGTLRIN
jgi:hypothetical protein